METVRLRRIYKNVGPYLTDPRELFLVVSIETQTLLVCTNDAIVDRYDASTSRFGNGNRENSLKTPLGFIASGRSFGAGAPRDAFSGTARIRAKTGTTVPPQII